MYLQDVFHNALEEVRAFFSDYKFRELSKDEFPVSELSSAWEGNIICHDESIAIIVAIPYFFPDELPQIYITKDFKYFPIPHVNEKYI